jgi:hypothetical protein
MVVVPFVNSPQGQELPFIANRLHSVKGKKVPQRMLYPSQALLAAAIADSPRGEGSLAAVRRSMAVQYGAEVTCPVTTQRLLRDIAAAAVTAWEAGNHAVPPFWRVVDPETPTARLLSGGAAFIRARRAEEAV